MSKRKSFSDKLRDAVLRSPMSRYEIWKRTGIDQGVLSKFVSGENGVRMDTADTLVELLDLDLVPRTGVRRRKRKES